MKKLTTHLLITAFVLQSAVSMAQIDANKMDRDLRVASGVLASLINNDTEQLFGGGDPEANYVDGYGVIFTIEDNMAFKYNYKFQYDLAQKAQTEARVALKEAQRVQREVEREIVEVHRESREKDREFRVTDKVSENGEEVEHEIEITSMPPIPDMKLDISINEEDLEANKEKSENENEALVKKYHEAFETFLIDYSQLISQLKPTDKILISTKSNGAFIFDYTINGVKSSNHIEKSRLSAEMLVKDHKDYQSGKLSREKLIEKIKFIENAEMVRKPDLDLFGNMLKTTYNAKYTETYFMSSLPTYELLDGLGVVYSIKVYSSYSDNGFFRMPGNNNSGLNEEDRDKAVEAMYPQFVNSFKENMIRYGSTIKSLGSTDKLIVKVKMTKCESCSFPSMVEYVVDKSVLDQFTKGALTLDQAKNKVKLK